MSSFIEIDTGTYSEQANAPMVTGLSKTYALHVKRMMVQCKRSEEIRELTKKKAVFDSRQESSKTLKENLHNSNKESSDSTLESEILQDSDPSGTQFLPLKLLEKIESLSDLILQKMSKQNITSSNRILLSKNYSIALMDAKFTLSYVQPNAAKWHGKRRKEIMGKYKEEVLGLHRESDWGVTVAVVLGISFGQIFIAKSISPNNGFLLNLLLSSTIGSFFCFGFQSLNHILMHSTMPYHLKMPLALLASACSPMPWFSYYIAGGHQRNHMNAGSETDIDREALFWIWEKVPHEKLDNPFGAVLWLSTAALFLPLAYMYSMFTCAYYNWKANKVEMTHFITESVCTSVVFYYCGCRWSSSLYLVFSGAFSMGFLGHPYLGFWLLQHLCVYDGKSPIHAQPTVSYYGNDLWNYLNYNILLHVEHHDFSKIPWHKVHNLRRIAPEYYTKLKYSTSILELMRFWIFSKGKKFDLTEMQNIVHKDDKRQEHTPSEIKKIQETERRFRRASVEAAHQRRQSVAENRGSDEVEEHTELQNAVKYNVYGDNPEKIGKRQYVASIFESPDPFEMALFYRLILFGVPIANCVLLILSLIFNGPSAETWAYISYVIAPYVTICVATHSMCRPKRIKLSDLKEEFVMVSFGVLVPLLLTLGIHMKYEPSGDYFRVTMKIGMVIVAFFGVAFGGNYMAKSVRQAVGFQDPNVLKEHLRYKVFFGGASMIISILYLVLESGGCVVSYIGKPTAIMLENCNGVKGPNYAVGMHLACIFVYSVYFGPFNTLTTSQLVKLDMTIMQRIEGFVFFFASACALFLFGAKRQNTGLPPLYERFMAMVYMGWFIIYSLELIHVFRILKQQKMRKLAIELEAKQEVEIVKEELMDLDRHPNHHFVRDHGMRNSKFDSAGSDIELGTTTPDTVKRNIPDFSLTTSERTRAISGSGIKTSRRVSDTMKKESGGFKRGKKETPEEQYVDAFHPILRFFLVNFCILEAAFVAFPPILNLLGIYEFHPQASHNMLLSAFACWPLVGLFIGTVCFSDFHGPRPKIAWNETIVYFFGALISWSCSGLFGFDMWSKGSTFIQVLLLVFVFIVTLVFYVFCMAMKFRCHRLPLKKKNEVVTNAFFTVGYAMLPIVYLSLESIGSVLHRNNLEFGGSRDIVKVNFLACMHVFGIAAYQIFYAPFSRYKAKDILKGNFDRLVGAELACFMISTMITLFVLATKVIDDDSAEKTDTGKMTHPERVLESMHTISSYFFGMGWMFVYVSNSMKFLGFFGGNSLSKKKRAIPDVKSKGCCGFFFSICNAFIVIGRSLKQNPQDGDDATSKIRADSLSGDESVGNGSRVVSLERVKSHRHFTLSRLWRMSFSVVPLGVMPLVTLMWNIVGPKKAPFPYLYLAFAPLNVLSSYVIFFSSPMDVSYPWLEVAVYLVGGPMVLIGGGIAEITHVSKGTPMQTIWTIFALRCFFSCILIYFLPTFMKLRKAIGETVPDLQAFVTDVVFTGTLKALVPVSYVCFTSLGCIVTSYENRQRLDKEIDVSCFQELATSVGVALHLVGVCVYQPFLLNKYVDYGISDIIQFTLPLRDKVNLCLVALSSGVSMCLFAYRNFDAWNGPHQMFIFVAGGILIIMCIWFWVLGQGAKHVTRLANQAREGGGDGKVQQRRRTGSVGVPRGRRGSAVHRGSITEGGTVENKFEEINNDANQTMGFATGEFGLGVLAPGLV
ncbi:hypothetical protein TL16_g01843, partial [Triparma laevis f. inornata]